MQRLLASRGLRGRKVPDLLIAAAAEESGLAVLHYDADFDLIARVTGQRRGWVVPPGTIDRPFSKRRARAARRVIRAFDSWGVRATQVLPDGVVAATLS